MNFYTGIHNALILSAVIFVAGLAGGIWPAGLAVVMICAAISKATEGTPT